MIIHVNVPLNVSTVTACIVRYLLFTVTDICFHRGILSMQPPVTVLPPVMQLYQV